ncbi:hypothetical protein B0H14DRAFT_2402337 [Mycena olivaceomarginata]|nr:hypothetical protein B0H14DRAFT_2402337 [Mycena olivaceomarginata]
METLRGVSTCYALKRLHCFNPSHRFSIGLLCIFQHASKRVYRLNPVSSKEEDLERNVIAALDSVSLVVMRRCMHF